jgi:uncharacterized protein (TIGR03435 family)
LLVLIGAVAVAGPLVDLGHVQAQSATSSFDVAVIKPDHLDGHHTRISLNSNSLVVTGATLKRLIAFAYNLNDFQIFGGPSWADTETYEVQAKILDEGVAEALKKLPAELRGEERRSMVKALLVERFKLNVSYSSKEYPIYSLVVMKDGPKFSQPATSDDTQPNLSNHNGDVKVKALPMGQFVAWLSGAVGRKVVDKTGLTGKYDFAIKYDERRQDLTAPGTADGSLVQATPPDSSGPSIFDALQDQLGLKLESQKGPVEILIIDSVEKPSPN